MTNTTANRTQTISSRDDAWDLALPVSRPTKAEGVRPAYDPLVAEAFPLFEPEGGVGEAWVEQI